MAKKSKKTRKPTPKKSPRYRSTKGATVARSRRSGGARKRARREVEPTFEEFGDLKDAQLMQHAKAYADEMFSSEEALEVANTAKQAIRDRMSDLDLHIFTGHGYEFTRTNGEEKFTARKLKRGSKPADTTAPEPADTDEPIIDDLDPDQESGDGRTVDLS